MKKTLSLLLALVLVLGSFSTVFAAMPETDVEKAELLKELGVLLGDNSGDLMLEKDLIRAEAVVLLSRLMKAEDVAKEFPVDDLPFDDVTDPIYPHYVAWAVANDLTQGISATKFDPKGDLTAQQFATFLLRALGYEIDAEAYETAFETAEELGIFADLNVEKETVLKRKDMAVMTFNVLYVPMKDSEVTLGEFLELELPQEEPEVPATFELEDVSATNLREVDIVFNKDVDEDSLAKANFLLGTTEATSVELLEDGVTVRAIFSMENQKEYTLKIKSVKSVDEQELKDVEEKFVAFDNTPPVVENVEVFGNKKIVVTFSEPVDETTAKSLANYRIDDKLFGAKVEVKGRKVHFELTARLADGVHTFEVKDNVKDYAKFRVLPNKNEIVVAKDDVKPEVASIDKVTQMEVVVTFTEPVEDNFAVKAAVGTFVDKETDDNLTYTLKFGSGGTGYLPLSGTEITLTDVTDYYGNKDTIKINVVPEVDLTRPEVKSVTVKSQSEIIVEFTKDILLDSDASFTLKTTDEEPQEVSITTAYVREKGADVKSKVKLTGTFEAGKYTLEITGVKDDTPLKNVVVPYVETIEVTDLTKPTVEAVKYNAPDTSKAGAIYVYFNEKVDADTALDKGNYSFVIKVNNQTKVYELGSSNTMTLLVDEKVVKIAIPKLSEDVEDWELKSATIVNVKDLAGNTMIPVFLDNLEDKFNQPEDIKLSNAKAVALNKVVVTVSGDINPYTVVATDYVLSTDPSDPEKNQILVRDALYKDGELTLTLVEDLTPKALHGEEKVPVYLHVVAENLEDIYGKKVSKSSISALPVADEIVPTLDKVVTGENANEIKFTFSEEVNFNGAGLVVKKDGKVVSFAVYSFTYEQDANKPNVFVVKFANELGLSGKTIEVGFPAITTEIYDDNDNYLAPTGWFKVKVK